jgi:hypothetical protein
MPPVVLASSRYAHILQANVGLSNQVCLFVVIEDGHFEIVVVGRVVNGESKFLVPVVFCQKSACLHRLPLAMLTIWVSGLPVWVLLAHALNIG